MSKLLRRLLGRTARPDFRHSLQHSVLGELQHHGHRGGRIGPSPRIMREALHQAARHLPAQGGDYREFAVDTADALASVCEGAALGLVERSLREAARELGETPTLLLHGGGADALAVHWPGALQSPSLVLEGLALWARLGTQQGHASL